MMLKVECKAVMLLQHLLHGYEVLHSIDPNYLRCLKRDWHCNIHEAVAAAAPAVEHGGISVLQGAMSFNSVRALERHLPEVLLAERHAQDCCCIAWRMLAPFCVTALQLSYSAQTGFTACFKRPESC